MDMPMKKKRTVASQAAARGPLPALPEGLIDQLVKGPMTPTEVQDLMLAFNKALTERATGAEMNLHLGYKPGQAKPAGQANERNGASGKTVITDQGPVRVELPRDRDGSFTPILIPKHERRFTGFDERIIAMYARGMSVREIQAFLAESYGTEVSPDFINSVTDEVMAETLAWQSRPLEPMYPVVFFDALRVKIRGDGVVSNKAVYLALGIQADGQRDVLGLWIEQTEGGEVLAEGVQRTEDPRLPGHPDRRRGWPQGAGRGDRHGVPAHDSTNLHRASDPQQPGIRRLERPQGRRPGVATDRCGLQRAGRAGGPAGLRRRPVGREVPEYRAILTARMGTRHAVLCVPA
jgi:putative transposase